MTHVIKIFFRLLSVVVLLSAGNFLYAAGENHSPAVEAITTYTMTYNTKAGKVKSRTLAPKTYNKVAGQAQKCNIPAVAKKMRQKVERQNRLNAVRICAGFGMNMTKYHIRKFVCHTGGAVQLYSSFQCHIRVPVVPPPLPPAI